METQLTSDRSEELSEILPIALAKLDHAGSVLSMNRAAHELAASLSSTKSLSEILPPRHKPLVRLALRQKRVQEMDWTHKGRTLHLIFKASQDGLSAYLFIIDLTAQEKAKAQLVQSEKMASLGVLIAGLAHEINTPLGAIHSNNDTISRSIARIGALLGGSPPHSEDWNREVNRLFGIVQGLCSNTSTAADRLIRIVGSLKNFARLDEADLKKADLHEGLESTLTIVQHQFKNRVQVVKRYGNIPLVECHPNAINQVFMNLLVNAGQAIPDHGTITIKTSQKGDFVRIAISDTGIGIPPENIPKVFDPGFTTKGVGVGTGLGLSICYKIAQEHEGKIDVESGNQGTTFTVTLPLKHPKKVKRA